MADDLEAADVTATVTDDDDTCDDTGAERSDFGADRSDLSLSTLPANVFNSYTDTQTHEHDEMTQELRDHDTGAEIRAEFINTTKLPTSQCQQLQQ